MHGYKNAMGMLRTYGAQFWDEESFPLENGKGIQYVTIFRVSLGGRSPTEFARMLRSRGIDLCLKERSKGYAGRIGTQGTGAGNKPTYSFSAEQEERYCDNRKALEKDMFGILQVLRRQSIGQFPPRIPHANKINCGKIDWRSGYYNPERPRIKNEILALSRLFRAYLYILETFTSGTDTEEQWEMAFADNAEAPTLSASREERFQWVKDELGRLNREIQKLRESL